MFLIDDLILAPIKATAWVVEQIHDHVQRELYNEDAVRRQLVALRLELEMDELGPEEFAEREAALLARLREIRLARLGGDSTGAPDHG